jgi:hypothetical protein
VAGPFYFAWADAGEAFDPVAHARWDDAIVDFSIDQVEGDFATLKITVKNPRVGLLAPGRKVWGWFSWSDGAGVVPLFNGRLLGVPDQIEKELVSLTLVARPEDVAAQKAAIAADIREYGLDFDPVWFSADTVDDPDNILESRTQLWDFDRVTLNVSLTDIVNGEDGTLIFTGNGDALYDSVSVTYGQNPLRRVNMTATASWQQEASGTLDLTGRHLPGAGAGAGAIISRTGGGLVDSWPRSGGGIGGGWTWQTATIKVLYGDISSSIVGDWVPDLGPVGSHYLDGGVDVSLGAFGVQVPGQPIGWAYHVALPLWGLTYELVLGYSASRRKTETLSFSLEADVQSTLTEPDDMETLDLTMSTSEVVSQGAIDAKDRAFFTTPRGQRSVEYVISVARAHLIARARLVDVQWETPFPHAVAVGLSCRKSAVLADGRLPGGQAAGKIKAYSLSMSGGRAIASVTIGCTVGKGGTVGTAAGEPDYCEAEYVGPDYQFYISAFALVPSGDVGYSVIEGLTPNDDGIDFHRMSLDQVLDQWEMTDNNSSGTQQAALSLFDIAVDSTGRLTATNETFAQVHLKLKDLTGGPFQTDIALDVTQLKIPKYIDLEAST